MITTRSAPARSGHSMLRSERQDGRINVSQGERWASLIGGGVLACYGLARGTPTGVALSVLGGSLIYRGYTGQCHMYQALGMNTAEHHGRTAIPAGQGIKFEESVTILRSPEELYAFWRNFGNLPRVMRHLQSVTETHSGQSHWVAKGPLGNVEWDAKLIMDRPNEVISWRSLEGADVDTSGSVHFRPAPANRGTEVRVALSYNPPAGRIGATLAWLVGQDPQRQVREDLWTLKRKMETGSVPTGNHRHLVG